MPSGGARQENRRPRGPRAGGRGRRALGSGPKARSWMLVVDLGSRCALCSGPGGALGFSVRESYGYRLNQFPERPQESGGGGRSVSGRTFRETLRQWPIFDGLGRSMDVQHRARRSSIHALIRRGYNRGWVFYADRFMLGFIFGSGTHILNGLEVKAAMRLGVCGAGGRWE